MDTPATKDAASITVGDVVQLKSGGPALTASYEHEGLFTLIFWSAEKGDFEVLENVNPRALVLHQS